MMGIIKQEISICDICGSRLTHTEETDFGGDTID